MRELEVAKRVARQAGELLMKERGSRLEVIIKADNSPCTQVDKLSSGLITAELLREFPNYGIIDEESLSHNILPNIRYKWVVDPLESTVSYINGAEHFGVMIGLLYDSTPILGVTYRPMIDELAFAAAGKGAFVEIKEGIKKIRVNDSCESDILVSRFRQDDDIDKIIRAFGNDHIRGMPSSFKTIEVAKGNASAFFCPKALTMNIWDLCAPQLILEEAGGKLTDTYDNPIDYSTGLVNSKGVIASNGIGHQAILDALKTQVYASAPKCLYT